jgi:hypothetical protein
MGNRENTKMEGPSGSLSWSKEKSHTTRLRTCYGTYLTATDVAFLLVMRLIFQVTLALDRYSTSCLNVRSSACSGLGNN